MQAIGRDIQAAFKVGFAHVFGTGFINAALSFVLSILIIRLLDVDEYGIYSYAFSIVTLFNVINALGAAPAALQLCSEYFEDEQRANTIFAYAYRSGFLIDALMAIIFIALALFAPLAFPSASIMLILYCIYPLLFFLNDMKLTYLRIWLKNKEYALLTNIQTILLVGFSLAGACVGQAYGLIIGQNLALLTCWLLACKRHPLAKGINASSLGHIEKKGYWQISINSAVNNGLGSALSTLGVFLVGALLADESQVAAYKAAITLPLGLLMIPSLLATCVYPFFARNKDDRTWTIVNYRKLTIASTTIVGTITIICIIFASSIITLLFGSEYAKATQAFQILMVGFFFTASLRQLTGNLLVSQRKLLFNTFNGATSLIAVTIASIALIPSLGLNGAAWAYTITMLYGTILCVPYYVHTIRKIPA